MSRLRSPPLIIAPNIVWNVTNGLATFRHTATNVGGAGFRFSVTGLCCILLFAVCGRRSDRVRRISRRHGADAKFSVQHRTTGCCCLFSLPIVALVMTASFVSNAYPNWMAPALVAMTILVTALLVRQNRFAWIYASIAIGAFVQLVFLVADANADRVTLTGFRKPDVYERTMGWRLLGEKVAELAQQSGAQSVVGERRYDVPSLIYYLRDKPWPVKIWKAGVTPKDHFELKFPFTSETPEPALLITPCPFEPRLKSQFGTVEPLGSFTVRTGPTTAPTYHAFKLTGSAARDRAGARLRSIRFADARHPPLRVRGLQRGRRSGIDVNDWK